MYNLKFQSCNAYLKKSPNDFIIFNKNIKGLEEFKRSIDECIKNKS